MGVEEPRLIRLDSDESEEHVLPEGETRIGRARANAICLRASTVSRFHCYLVRNGDDVRVFDGKSKNPARLNGEPVCGQLLRTGQVLVVGSAEFVYQGTVAERAPVPAAAAPARAASPAVSPQAASPFAPARPGPAPEAARPAFPARRRPALSARTRRSGTGRAREPAMIAALVVLLAAPAVVWLVVSGIPALQEKSAARIPAADPAASDVAGEIEARIAAVESSRDREIERTSARSAKKIDELSAQLLELHSELERLRAQGSAGGEKTQRAAAQELPSGKSRDQREKFYGTISGLEDEPRREPTTVVVPQKPPRVRLKPEEVRKIAERLRRNVEDYATHVITPAILAPDLEKLLTAEGRDAASALIDLEKHARDLLRTTDKSIASNRKRRADLLEKARSDPSSAPPSSDPKAYPKYSPAAGGRETDQRWLDSFETAMKIHQMHREYLAPLREAILVAIARVSAPEGLDELRIRLPIDDDEDLCLAIARSFEGARWHESIPALARRLSSARSDRLRGGLRKSLAALVGEDLGDRSAPWLEWWEKRR